MAKSKPWTQDECDACICGYALMLHAEMLGEKYSKAALNRILRDEVKPNDQVKVATYSDYSAITKAYGIEKLRGSLSQRGRPSIELKMMNISAARKSLGLPTINGYKPLPNMQALLKNRVRDLSK